MTDATTLADALVEAGIGWSDPRGGTHPYKAPHAIGFYTAKGFITDWRVAGKVLEDKTFNIRRACELRHMNGMYSVRWLRDPRSIIEAWYQAQETDDEASS